MLKYLTYYYLFSLFFVLPIEANSETEVVADISRNSIKIGEHAIISVKAQGTQNDKVDFPQYDSLQQIIPGIEVLQQNDTVLTYGKYITYSRKYYITSFDTANYTIPPIEVKINNKIFKSNILSLYVEPIAIDTTNVEKIYDLKPPMEPAFDIREWLIPLFLSIITFITSIFLIYILIRIKDNKPIIRRFHFRPYIPPHKAAMDEIAKLKSDNILIADNKEYYTCLTNIVRKYLQGRFGFNAMEMTTEEIVSHLQKLNDSTSIKELSELFSTADLVKFAKAQPDLSENDNNLLNAITYIKNTKKEEVVNLTPKEIVVEDIRSKKNKKVLYISIFVVSIVLILMVIKLIQYLIILNY